MRGRVVQEKGGIPVGGVKVTLGRPDWSVAPVPAWAGRRVTVRLSRAGDAIYHAPGSGLRVHTGRRARSAEGA